MPAFMEPFRIKSVEPIPFTTRAERDDVLRASGYNLFGIDADKITVDLLTDSGTGAMSAAQWSALQSGDESYAGARSFRRFEKVVRELTGLPEVIPVHQGRAAERILMSCLLEEGTICVSNTHFDTTRANVEDCGARALDLPDTESAFGGDLDTAALRDLLDGPEGASVRCVILTITNNAAGGQPVSMANARETRKVCDEYGIKLIFDAARFAENAYLVVARDPTYASSTPRAVAQEMFQFADGCCASLKKDAMANIGGLIALRDPRLAAECREKLILSEGYSTYGGLAGRDLDALAQGLLEATDIHYLRYRAETAEWFGTELAKAGLPVLRPTGCHAVYVDAARLLPHLTPQQLPGSALACELYAEGGIRTSDLGTLCFGRVDPDGGPDEPAPRELVRFALPRRVYTRSHLEYVVETAAAVARNAESIPAYRIVEQPAVLRHFTSRLEPVG